MSPYILTFTGKQFHFLSNDASEICIDDLAKALSNVNRYTGHTVRPYSVAEHAIHVASLLPPDYQMMGLLHDGSEAYLNDISSPLKSLLPDYRRIEESVQNKVWAFAGISLEAVDEHYAHVKLADMLMYLAELRNINPDEYELAKDIPGTEAMIARIESEPALQNFPYYIPHTIACGLFKKVVRNIGNGNFLTRTFTDETDMTKYLMR